MWLAGQLNLQHPVRLLINLLALAALMRFWPLPGQRHPLGVNEPITVQVRALTAAGWPGGMGQDAQLYKAKKCEARGA